MNHSFSLRFRLTLSLLAVLGLALPVFSFLLFSAFSSALLRAFDERLIDDAKSIVTLAEEQGRWQFEAHTLEDFEPGPEAAYYQAWLDGVLAARSRSLVETAELKTTHGGGGVMAPLPDGRNGRTLTINLPSRAAGHREVTIAIARSTEDLEATLRTLERLLVTTLIGVLALAVLAVVFTIRAGLKPLQQLSHQVDAITAERLDRRLDGTAFPPELAPTVTKLNEVLGRLEAAFARERQFTADVSHELRTPLTGLKSTLEVAALKTRDVETYKQVLHDGLEMVGQLDVLIEKLLLLARAGAGQIELNPSNTELSAFVDDCMEPFMALATQRGLSFANRTQGVMVSADRTLLRMVVSNLLSNAVSYTSRDGQIVVEADAQSLRVKDSGPAIPPEMLERIFGAFFRLEKSRAGTGEHCGIGLALVRALCTTMGMTVAARNEASWVVFEVRWAS